MIYTLFDISSAFTATIFRFLHIFLLAKVVTSTSGLMMQNVVHCCPKKMGKWLNSQIYHFHNLPQAGLLYRTCTYLLSHQPTGAIKSALCHAKYTVKSVRETTSIKRPPLLRDHIFISPGPTLVLMTLY